MSEATSEFLVSVFDRLSKSRQLSTQLKEQEALDEYFRGARPEQAVRRRGGQQRSRMHDVVGGVMEYFEETGQLDGVLQTGRSRFVFEGKATHCEESFDIQSGPAQDWRTSFDRIKEGIRNAYEDAEPREGLRAICEIWDQLDQTSELAAARSRILIGKIDPPPLAMLAEWFSNQKHVLSQVEDDELPANPVARETAENLVRASLAALSREHELPQAELDIGPMGRVIIDWISDRGRFQWVVDADDLAWPAIKVYELKHETREGVSQEIKTRVLHNAFDAVDSFLDFFKEEES